MNKPLKYYQINTFTRAPFKGEPVVVILLDRPLDEHMGRIAGEFGGRDTVFCQQIDSGDEYSFLLKTFSSGESVAMTDVNALGVAKVLWSEGMVGHLKKIRLTDSCQDERCLSLRSDHLCIETMMPAANETPVNTELLEPLFGPIKRADKLNQTIVLELTDEAAVRKFAGSAGQLSELGCHGLVLFASANRPEANLICRSFHCVENIRERTTLAESASVLARVCFEKSSSDCLTIEMASPRSAVIHLENLGGDKIVVSGQAVTTLKGFVLTSPNKNQ